MEDRAALASLFINTTSSHLFLTGKAGTGKTTFLRNLAQYTHKSFIVVAPTGIAALNAGGTTIHSQFLIPPSTFLPDKHVAHEGSFGGKIINSQLLARHHPLNQERRRVLRSIDLLVIDEVSMLRADLLDAIDYRMRAARGNYRESFGGVQVLFIGDLYQLPPVVRREEWALLSEHYNSIWFYEALALRNQPPVYIELDRIYRQHDERFIRVLNNLRNNTTTPEDIAVLNEQYRTPDQIAGIEEVITLTTHNVKADEINLRQLQALPCAAQEFPAHLEGDFPESMYPVQAMLVLKPGTQIMFVRNDGEGKMYFNGKLATVEKLDAEKEEIWVIMADTHIRYALKRERWENKRYKVNDVSQELEEDVIGAFEQFPIKLAWAITVHKSQGLTFDRAIIDVGQAFTDGQVYVALSRLRSLEGLILRTRIDPSVISTDRQIVEFVSRNHHPEALPSVVKQQQEEYVRQCFLDTFDFSRECRDLQYLQRDYAEMPQAEGDEVPVLKQIEVALTAEQSNTEKFTRQLLQLLSGDIEKFMERLQQGSRYYKNLLLQLERLLLTHLEGTRLQKRVKAYLEQLTTFDVILSRKIEAVSKIVTLVTYIRSGSNTFDFSVAQQERVEERKLVLAMIRQQLESEAPTKKAAPTRKKRKKKSADADTRSTFDITIDAFTGGKSAEEIAKERSLALSTIEGHLAKAVEQGRLSIHQVVHDEAIVEVRDMLNSLEGDRSVKRLKEALENRYSYGKLQAVLFHLQQG